MIIIGTAVAAITVIGVAKSTRLVLRDGLRQIPTRQA